MCGILAIYRTSPKAPDIQSEDLKSMARALSPSLTEGASYALLGSSVGLGQTDCSGNRFEPLFNKAGTVTLIADAKLTDRSLWLRKLSDRGFRFGAQSDNEILLFAYEEFGPACFTEFSGKFAFVIWDSQKELLIAARDSLGLASLYITQQQGRAYIASETKAFFTKIGLEKRLNPRYFAESLLSVSHPTATPFGGIKALTAGSYLTIDKSGKQEQHFFVNHKEYPIQADPTVELTPKPLTAEMIAKQLHEAIWILETPVDKVSQLIAALSGTNQTAPTPVDKTLRPWPRYGIPRSLLVHFLHRNLRVALPPKILVRAQVNRIATVESVSWKDIMRSPTGAVIFKSYMSLEELDHGQLFSPLLTKIIQYLWLWLPVKSSLGHALDAMMGFVLTCQMTNRLFLKYRFKAQSLYYWEEVSAERHLPTRASLLVHDHPEPRSWAIPVHLDSKKMSDWHRFVLRHTNVGNFIFHFISLVFFFGGPVAALVTWESYWLLPFFISGMVGTAGHYLFRDGSVSVKEATIQIMVPFYVMRMFYLLLKGKYSEELKNARVARHSAASAKGILKHS